MAERNLLARTHLPAFRAWLADRETLCALMADPVFTAAERRRVEVQATSDTRVRAAIAWATTELAARRPCCGAYCSDVCTCLQESAA